MRPTYYELLQLNPLLRHRSPKEVEALLDTIEECGYVWDQNQKMFYNREISRGVRTMGLDIFTPERFCEIHSQLKQEATKYPEAEALRRHYTLLWTRWAPKFITTIFVWIVLGWTLGWRIWLFVVLGLIISFIVFYIYCGMGWEKAKKMKIKK